MCIYKIIPRAITKKSVQTGNTQKQYTIDGTLRSCHITHRKAWKKQTKNKKLKGRLTILIITVNVSGLNIPIKKEIGIIDFLNGSIYAIYKINTSNIKI